MDDDILTVDVINNFFTTPQDVGEDGLQLFVVAPARIENHREGSESLKDFVTYADSESAYDSARRYSKGNKHDYCVYKLTTVARFNFKGA